MRRRRWRSAVAVAVALVAGASAAPASAGTIDVGACELASAVINPSDIWLATDPFYDLTLDADVPTDCASGVDGMQFRVLAAGSARWNSAIRISTTVPFAGVSLTGFTGSWTTNPALADGWWIRAQADTDLGLQTYVAGCTSWSQCRTWSAAGTRVDLPAQTRSLSWSAYCGASPCTAAGPYWMWRASRMTLTINDPADPGFDAGSAQGAVLTTPSRWLRGSHEISIAATDYGGLGIQATRVLVDGRVVPSLNDAMCAYRWEAGNWCYETAVTTATINTAGLADGEHELTIEATDASGNRGERRSTFLTDNHAETAAGATLTPASWTTTNAFDVAWPYPTGVRAPIVASHVTRCNAAGEACVTRRYPGAAGPEITVPAAGEWRLAVAVEDAAGNIGPATAAGVARLASEPTPTAGPSVSGTARESETLSSDLGSWTGEPAPEVEARWLVCDAAGENCAPVSGAWSESLQLRREHVGATVRLEVTARNAGGETRERSAPSAVVEARPPALVMPPSTRTPGGRTVPPPAGSAIRAAIVLGGTLEVGGDAWAGTDDLTVAVQWQRCNAAVEACRAIAGATARAYVPAKADVGSAVRAEIVASNMAGSASTVTDPVLIVDVEAPRDETAEGEDEKAPAPPNVPPREQPTPEPAVPAATASALSNTAPRAQCVRELRVHLPARGRLRVDGDPAGSARVLAGDREVLRIESRGGAVSVRNGRGALLGTAPSESGMRWVRRSPTRVAAQAPDGSALVVLGIDNRRGRAIVKGRTCRYTTTRSTRVIARADRRARWSAWLVDANGTPLTNAEVVVTDGPNTYRTTTDDAGRARLEARSGNGSRNITVTYSGDGRHGPTSLTVKLTVQNVVTVAGRGEAKSVRLHGTLRGSAREIRLQYRDHRKRWRPLGRARVDAGRWTLRAPIPQRHAGGPQLVVRAVVDASGPFASRAGGEIRIDLREKAAGR